MQKICTFSVEAPSGHVSSCYVNINSSNIYIHIIVSTPPFVKGGVEKFENVLKGGGGLKNFI